MYYERKNPENPTLFIYSETMKNQTYLNLFNSYNELPLDEKENSDFNPFNFFETDKQNDDVFSNIDEELYYGQHILTVPENLDNLLVDKIRQKSILVNNDNIKDFKESIRNWNQMNKIKRNLIQNNYLDWINCSIENPEFKLKKIEPSLLKNKYKNFSDILHQTLKTIYSNDICQKEIIGHVTKEHNKNVIEKMEKMGNTHDFNIKINLSFRDSLKLFFNKPIENKIFDDKLKEGLKDYKHYFLSGNHKPTYARKLCANLKKLYEMVDKDTKQIEKTTGPSSEHSEN